MRAAITSSYGPPECVRVGEVPDPHPGPGEILVRVAATTVNRTDCAYRSAKPFFMRAVGGLRRPRWPVLGTEFAGEVVEVATGVTRFGLGDRVFGYCEGRFGAHAELLAVAEDSMVATVPEGVPLQTAAAATEGCHYASSALRRTGVGAGDEVLVNGATGGIGSAAVQLAAAAGARVTGVCGPDHLDLVRELGGVEVVDRTSEDFTRRGARYDVVVDAVGKSSFGRCRRILKHGGRYVSSELGPGGQNPLLALVTPLGRGRRVVFPLPDEGVEVVEGIRARLAEGSFRPVIDRTYPLERIAEAYRYVETGQKIGNVVITVQSPTVRG